ncbi:TPA: lamin tail domain-containing protein [Candidatus Woesearchaeota archaeon]|nr:lamin tail domain-containing protein [Candidatus Woesearchaeota archaeon]
MRVSWLYFFVIFLFSFPFVSAEVLLNEIMYAPSTSIGGSANEWVELYALGGGNETLSGCFFQDIELPVIIVDPYAILVRQSDLFNDTYYNASSTYEVSFGRGLANDGGSISLRCPSFEEVVYYNDSLAKSNNFSLERSPEGEWKESIIFGGTPSKNNSISAPLGDFASLEITEIMVDPFGDDDVLRPGGEWIEIYNRGKLPVSLRELVLYDQDDDHELRVTDSSSTTLTLCSHCYAVVYRNGDTDFDLSRNTDAVRLAVGYPLRSESVLDIVSFSSVPEGMSLSHFNGDWVYTAPTPGEDNLYTGLCDWQIDVMLNNSFSRPEDLSFTVEVGRRLGYGENITVQGIIEDGYGNIVKEYSPWTNDYITSSSHKTYSPRLAEGAYNIVFWLGNLTCRDGTLGDNRISRAVYLGQYYQNMSSRVEIEDVDLLRDGVTWGESVPLHLFLYKGNSTQKVIRVWVEAEGKKVSSTSKVSVQDEFSGYDLTIPVELVPRCENEEIRATAIVEGLGERDEVGFTIQSNGDDCDESDILSPNSALRSSFSSIPVGQRYAFTSVPYSILPGDIFPIRILVRGSAKDELYDLWSFVAEGRKCVSCLESTVGRNDTIYSLSVPRGQEKEIELLVKADANLPPGSYELRVIFRRVGVKTTQDLRQIIFVNDSSSLHSNSSSFLSNHFSQLSDSITVEPPVIGYSSFNVLSSSQDSTGMIVYESTTSLSKKSLPWVVVVAFCCLLFMFFKKGFILGRKA